MAEQIEDISTQTLKDSSPTPSVEPTKTLSVDFDSLQVGPLIRSPSISTLPPELLRQIIETSTASWTGSPTTQTRQTILSQLSLVSSHFQSIAQPLLFEVVGLHQDRQVERWLDVMKKLGTRHVILGLATTNFSLELLISLSCLRSLTLFTNATFMSEHEFDLAILSTCPNLENLYLAGMGFLTYGFKPLSSLRRLDLTPNTALMLSSFLDPLLLPSLVQLATLPPDLTKADIAIVRLLPQLDILRLKYPVFEEISESSDVLLEILPRTTVLVYSEDLDPDSRSLQLIHHLVLQTATERTSWKEAYFTLRRLTRIVADVSSSRDLRSLRVDPIWGYLNQAQLEGQGRSSPDAPIPGKLRRAVKRLVKKCKKRGIVLIWAGPMPTSLRE